MECHLCVGPPELYTEIANFLEMNAYIMAMQNMVSRRRLVS